jgi:uncharacterized protein YggE
MKQFTFLSFLLFYSVSIVSAQVAGNKMFSRGNTHSKNKTALEIPTVYFENQNTILLEANVLYNAPADKYVAIFNINQLGQTADIATQMVDSRINGVKQEFLKLGIPEKDFYVDMLTFVPEYEYEVEKKIFSKTYNEIPKGFRLQKNIHVVYSNSRILDKMIAVCAKHEIYDLVKVEYFNSNSQVYYDTLRNEAKKILKSKLADYKELGIAIESANKQFAENTFVKYPGEQYESYYAFNSSSLEALKKKTGVNKVKKTQSFYYQPVSYKKYDVVFNPIINEPVIQYAYSLKLKLVIDQPEKKKQLYILTPNGDLKLIEK